MALWKCGTCGYVHDGDKAPVVCPKCGQKLFSEIPSGKAELIEKSRKTNEMHVAIMGLYAKVQKWAQVIKDEDLDPPCVAIAERVLKDTHETIQSINAEIETHVGKGKWG